MSPDTLVLGGLWYITFLLSTTCHEGAHALVAKWGGDDTAFRGGQVSLNPLPHIQREPFGMILAPVITYFLMGWMLGWASAPYDPFWAARHPKRAGWMALAGPAANFLLVILAGLALYIGINSGHFVFGMGSSDAAPAQQIAQLFGAPEGSPLGGLASFLSILFTLNLLLGTFNLIPAPPLDGSTAILVALPTKAAQRYMEWLSNPMIGMVGILLAWTLFPRIFGPILRAAISIFH
ncbi:MAG: site-2 protease family protein [Myxococcales bacterium]|nr:site-2 protease family protein [Myxococcales bacterium]